MSGCPLDPLPNFTPFSDIERHAHLTTEDELEDPHDEHPGDAHQEGEDGGQEKAPPFPLPQAFLRIIMLKQIPINLFYFYNPPERSEWGFQRKRPKS